MRVGAACEPVYRQYGGHIGMTLQIDLPPPLSPTTIRVLLINSDVNKQIILLGLTIVVAMPTRLALGFDWAAIYWSPEAPVCKTATSRIPSLLCKSQYISCRIKVAVLRSWPTQIHKG